MRKINAFNLCFMFAGGLLGAGFLSGNELMQFFGKFGKHGIIGCFLSVLMITVFGIMILYISRNKGGKKIENIVLFKENRIAGAAVTGMQAMLVFSIIVIMTAGAAELAEEMISVDSRTAAAVFCIVCSITACIGVGAASAFFSFLVPLIVSASVIVCIFALVSGGLPALHALKTDGTDALLSNWLLSAAAYLSYSVLASVGVIAPLSGRLKSKNTYILGMILGGTVLFIIAVSIILSVFCVEGACESPLPMLEVAGSIGTAFKNAYAVFLGGGMLGAAVSGTISVSTSVSLQFELTAVQRKIFICAVMLIAYLISIAGFGELIGTVYPLFGYFGIAVLILIAVNFIKTVKKH